MHRGGHDVQVRVLVRSEEVGAAKVRVACSETGVDALSADDDVGTGRGGVGFVEVHGPRHVAERSPDGRHHHVLGGEEDVGVGGVDRVCGHLEGSPVRRTYGAVLLLTHQPYRYIVALSTTNRASPMEGVASPPCRPPKRPPDRLLPTIRASRRGAPSWSRTLGSLAASTKSCVPSTIFLSPSTTPS